jgi:elongation factor Ts
VPDFTAKDVQALRKATGAGMLDAKKALEQTSGDMDEAAQYLRLHGLAGAAKREDREASQGAVAAVRNGDAAAVVELRCETDFVAKADEFVALTDELAALVASKGVEATSELSAEVDRLRTTLKENIFIGRVERLVAETGQVVDTYLHQQAGRGVNAVAVERATVAEISRNEGKPEAAMEKIVDGRMSGWFKERVLLDQSYVKDEKQTITGMLGSARIVAFSQVVIGS